MVYGSDLHFCSVRHDLCLLLQTEIIISNNNYFNHQLIGPFEKKIYLGFCATLMLCDLGLTPISYKE